MERETLDELAREGCSCAELSNKLDNGEINGYLLKPMNCPHHIKIYASQKHSYRDLPIRLAEFGTVYRWEQSGELGGMTRVRCFTQDDAHLFCTEEQLPAEVLGCLNLVKKVFSLLGMQDYRVRVGLRDPDSAKYTGDPANWDKAEKACRDVRRQPRRAVFRGTRRGRVLWTEDRLRGQGRPRPRMAARHRAGRLQPARPLRPSPIPAPTARITGRHGPRAPFGSMERFIGCLIEHFAGSFRSGSRRNKSVC